ncbi:hypothetical protein LMIY3S_05350 [Labrys miyagiensis]
MGKSAPIAWPQSREDMQDSLQGSGLPMPIAHRLAEQAEPALLLATLGVAEEAEIPLGSSKIGGLPDLPAEVPWPQRPPYADAAERAAAHHAEALRLASEATRPGSWMTPEQARLFSRERDALADAVGVTFPLAFLAQLDLASLSQIQGFPSSLPAEGRLLLFFDYWECPPGFDPGSAAGFRLIWDRTPTGRLRRKSVPAAFAATARERWSSLFRPAAVTAFPILTAIPPSDRNFDAFPRGLEAGTFWDEESDEGRYEEWLARFGTPDGKEGPNHRLGGWPIPLQNGMQAMAQLATRGIHCGAADAFRTAAARRLLDTAGDWRLVLQIGRDDAAGLFSSGCLYVLMREQDIRLRAFDRAWMICQSD